MESPPRRALRGWSVFTSVSPATSASNRVMLHCWTTWMEGPQGGPIDPTSADAIFASGLKAQEGGELQGIGS